MNNIAVTGTGSLIGQAIIKSIKSSRFKSNKLIGMDYFSDTIGSHWTDSNYVLPDILDDDVDNRIWVDFIVSVIQENKVKILFIGVDFELYLFSKYKHYIENLTSCVIVVSDKKTIKIADDKYLTYKFLKDNHFNYPLTFLTTEIDNAIVKQEITFPMVVKPRNGYRSRNIYVVRDKIELYEKIQLIENPIIQEYIGNDKTEYTCGVITFHGNVKQSIVLKRDLKDGNTSRTYLKNSFSKDIKEYIEKVSAELGQFGVCNFQLRIDNNIPKIFEINARHSGTTYFRSIYGFNEIEYLLEYFLNNKEIEFKIREGIVHRYFDEFFVEL